MIDVGQLRELEPFIAKAHEEHLKRSPGPINPVLLLQQATGTVDRPYLETHAAIKSTADEHFLRLDALERDYRPVLAASFLVNLLTEDNLPHYTKTIDRVAMNSEPFSGWLNQWTAEEEEHGVLLRDYGLFSGIIGNADAPIPHTTYGEGVTSQLTNGTEISIESLAQGFAYLSFQEGLTKVAHQVEETLLDQVGSRSVRRVSGDEANHERLYAELQKAMFQLFPDEALIATLKIRKTFQMPGAVGIPQFDRLAKTIAVANLFSVNTVRSVMDQHLRSSRWGIAGLRPTTSEARAAQEELLSEDSERIEKQEKIDRFQDLLIKKAKVKGTTLPFILGKTVAVESKELVPLAA